MGLFIFIRQWRWHSDSWLSFPPEAAFPFDTQNAEMAQLGAKYIMLDRILDQLITPAA